MAYSTEVEVAKALATKAHAGQTDKASLPYITHPERVASRLNAPEAQVVGWLHDTVEDTALTIEDIREQFGPEIGKAGDVDTCTIMLRFENGTLGVIDNSRQAVYGYDQRIVVFGSKGCVTADNETANNTTLYTADAVTREKPLWFFLERYNDAYIAEAHSFVDACLNDRETLVGVNDGLQPVLIGLAAKESCERGGAPVKVANSTHND